jgi:hypothetical protein
MLERFKKWTNPHLTYVCLHCDWTAGRVCVPIDPQDCDNFDPTTVPTLAQVHAFFIPRKQTIQSMSEIILEYQKHLHRFEIP